MESTLKPNKKKFLGKYNFEEMESLKKDAKPLTCLSMFTGCGGMALGVNAAGFEVRVMVEIDKDACKTLRANWTRKENGGKKKWARWAQEREPVILERDIKGLTSEEILKAADLRIGEATLLEGGFPCQGFSFANSQRGEVGMDDARNWLYLELVRVIRETLPKAFVLENVPGLISMEKGKIIKMICNDLSNSGYSVDWDILNAVDYGVPQNRKRVIIIGSRNDVFRIPEGPKYNPQLYMGGAPGLITHPDWFLKKYPEYTQSSLFNKLKNSVEKLNG